MGAEDRGSPRSVRDTLYDSDAERPALSATLSSEVELDAADDTPAARDSAPRHRDSTDPDRRERLPADDPFGDLSTGAELGGRYRLEKILGKGATGVVFEASHLVIGKRVAVKCLYPHHRATPNAVERFFREARIAATVEHPNVIQVFDAGDEKDTMFLAMELLEGESLGDRLDRGPLPVFDAMDLFLGIMDGVAAVHERGVVHRDLKPDNILLTAPRQAGAAPIPKVLDFGISKLKEPGLRELTTLGTVMGTPFYMAPEQIANTRDVDARADVYSLGVMLYEALDGDVPYAADSVLDIFKAAQTGGARPIDENRPDVPAELARLVAKAMAPKPEDRYPSVREMEVELRQIVLGQDEPQVQDVRRTVRDVSSPLVDLRAVSAATRRTLDEDAPAPSIPTTGSRALPSARDGDVEQRLTVPLDLRPPTPRVERMPAWGWLALAASGAITLASVITAVVALAS